MHLKRPLVCQQPLYKRADFRRPSTNCTRHHLYNRPPAAPTLDLQATYRRQNGDNTTTNRVGAVLRYVVHHGLCCPGAHASGLFRVRVCSLLHSAYGVPRPLHVLLVPSVQLHNFLAAFLLCTGCRLASPYRSFHGSRNAFFYCSRCTC
jgi:hypothetical protein